MALAKTLLHRTVSVQALKMLTRTLEEAKQSGDAWIAEI